MRRDRTVAALFALAMLIMAAPPPARAEMGPCEDERLGPEARCGTVTVPENRARPEGRTIGLNVVVLPATQPSKQEPVFLLAGGPGQGATDLAGLALGPLASVRETRDFVLVDQRGTGDSNPLLCLSDTAENPQTTFDGLFDPQGMAACLEEFSSRADVTLYSTPHVVADLEEVRARLGYDRVILWGGSGGTRTALVWMREHPERIAAALLDGVVPTSYAAPEPMAQAAQEALEKVLEDCRAQESCRAAYPELAAEFAGLLARFEDGPVATHVTREDGTEVPVEMSRGGFGYAVRGMLYQARLAASLPKRIHEAATSGDLSAFAQALWQRDVALRPVVAMGVHFAVYCAEDLPFIDPERAAASNAGTFLGDYLVEQYGAVCDVWKAEPVPPSYRQPTRSQVPTLIFSGHYDPSTPARFGEEVARHLANSRHVMVRDQGHGAEFGCGRELAIQFLRRGSLEELGPACQDAGPIEFEI